MSEQQGIVETKEALLGLLKLTKVMAESFKDGFQAADIAVLITKIQEEPLKSELLAAYNGIDKVPSEVKDVSILEVASLLPEVIPAIADLMAAIRK